MHFNVRRRRIITTVLVTAAIAAAAEAQRPTSKVRIAVKAPCSTTAANTIWVVLYGNETDRFPATRETEAAPWTGSTTDGKTFEPEHVTASLRLGGRRTDCRKVTPREDDHDDQASFTFDCDRRDVIHVDLASETSRFDVRYERKLVGGCREHGEFRMEPTPYSVEDIWVTGEELRLHLSPKWRDDISLLVLDAISDSDALPMFVRGNEKPPWVLDKRFTAKRTKAGLLLTVADTGDIYEKQLSRNRASANARSFFEKQLRKDGVKDFIIAVKDK